MQSGIAFKLFTIILSKNWKRVLTLNWTQWGLFDDSSGEYVVFDPQTGLYVPGPAPPVLPDPVALRTPFGELTIDVERRPDGYRITGRFHLVPGVVAPEDAAELRSFLVKSRRALERPLEVP